MSAAAFRQYLAQNFQRSQQLEEIRIALEEANPMLWVPRSMLYEMAEKLLAMDRQIVDLKHRSAGHIDALLLYATGFPGDSHPNDAIDFYRTICDRPMRTEGQFRRGASDA